WPPTSKPSAAAWRSSPTSATNGSPSSNPAPKQADLSAPVAYQELRGQGEPGNPPRHLRTGFCLLRGCGQPVSIVVLLTGHSTSSCILVQQFASCAPPIRSPNGTGTMRFARWERHAALASGAVSAGSNPAGGTAQRNKFEHNL